MDGSPALNRWKMCVQLVGSDLQGGVSRVNTLYISYDGMLEPLGHSQVVNYLVGLSKRYGVTLISFEKPSDFEDVERVREMEARLRACGIRWVRLRYHKFPPVLSTCFDIMRGVVAGVRVGLSRRRSLVHARGYVASLIAILLKQLFGVKFIFDMRGFWADEKVDGGHWSRRSPIYKLAKRCEKRFFESADAIVSLTHEGVKALVDLGYSIRRGTPIEVIPTCTDLKKYVPGPKDPSLLFQLGLAGHLVIGCTGTMSNWYLRQPTLNCLSYLAKKLDRVKILLVTREDHDQLRSDAMRAGIPESQLVLVRAAFTAMPEYLRLIDLGVFFIKPTFSKKGSSATKLGEFLATGIPVIINDGIGDSGWIVRQEKVGLVLSGADLTAFEGVLSDIAALLRDPLIGRRCRDTAKKYFDLDQGVQKYAALYARLIGAESL